MPGGAGFLPSTASPLFYKDGNFRDYRFVEFRSG